MRIICIWNENHLHYLLCILIVYNLKMIVNNMLIEATLLIVVFGKIGYRTIKRGLVMGKYRRNDWTIVSHSDAF